MDINWDAAKVWLDLLQWFFTITVAIAVWIRTGRTDNRKSISDLEKRMIGVEESIKHAPSHDDIAKLQSQYAGLESKLDRVTNTLDRIHDYLMNKKQ